LVLFLRAFLFAGDADENFYVVQSGKLNVFITETDGSTVTLKIVKEGDSIASLLSFTDVLTVSGVFVQGLRTGKIVF
jgi:CRP-like cAMP-binding protein